MNYLTTIHFHGGCIGCTRQTQVGIDECRFCRYFDSDWTLPDLNNRPPSEADRARDRIKKKYSNETT